MSAAAALAEGLALGDRRALSKAVTLVESSRQEDEALASELLTLIQQPERTYRVGVTGVPGAGKSTLIEGLGMAAIAEGRRVAVLAIDPSSRQSGGSVLGDKTRMTSLSNQAAAFVRPSPSLGLLGGTAARTREVILLCEAAGYDVVFVETVGVGQSEEQVATMVDCVLLVLLAGAGDEVSSMKRGLLEAADLIVFNKADGERRNFVQNEAASLQASLSSAPGQPAKNVQALSALDGSGPPLLWAELLARWASGECDGSLSARRVEQRSAWFDAALSHALQQVFSHRPDLKRALDVARGAVQRGEIAPWAAAQSVLGQLLRAPTTNP